MDWINFANPLTHMAPGEYLGFWQHLFATLLVGIWGRALAWLLLALSFWLGVRRRNFILGFWTFVMAGTIAYGAAVLRFLGLLSHH